MDNKQLLFLSELYTGVFIDLLEQMNKARDGEPLELDMNINDDPETAFYWGEILGHAQIITSFYGEFKINLFEVSMEDAEGKEFAKELLAVCLDIERIYQNLPENGQLETQSRRS